MQANRSLPFRIAHRLPQSGQRLTIRYSSATRDRQQGRGSRVRIFCRNSAASRGCADGKIFWSNPQTAVEYGAWPPSSACPRSSAQLEIYPGGTAATELAGTGVLLQAFSSWYLTNSDTNRMAMSQNVVCHTWSYNKTLSAHYYCIRYHTPLNRLGEIFEA